MEGGRASPQRRRDEAKNRGETGINKENGRGKNSLGKDRKKISYGRRMCKPSKRSKRLGEFLKVDSRPCRLMQSLGGSILTLEGFDWFMI